MSGSGSVKSDDMDVRGLSFNMASMSVMTVSSSFKVMNALTSVFFTACLVNPMIRTQNPPYHGAHLGINYLVTFWDSNAARFKHFLQFLHRSQVSGSIV